MSGFGSHPFSVVYYVRDASAAELDYGHDGADDGRDGFGNVNDGTSNPSYPV